MLQLLDCTLGDVLYQGPETYVRRVTHSQSGERLVVKLPTSSTPSLRTLGRLAHEHQILGKLAAVPGVLRVRGLTQQAGSAALWLEAPALQSLDRVLATNGHLTLKAALRITLALSHVLDGIHMAGVIHKDVKPQNVPSEAEQA